MRSWEHFIEKIVWSSRWLLAPIYLGLIGTLVGLGIKYFIELFSMLTHLSEYSKIEMALAILDLIDLTLIASLVYLVVLSSYEQFVSKIEVHADSALKASLAIDSNQLKIKLAVSIVAISSIHLLRVFINLAQTPLELIIWYPVIHLTLIVSCVLLVCADRIIKRSARQAS